MTRAESGCRIVLREERKYTNDVQKTVLSCFAAEKNDSARHRLVIVAYVPTLNTGSKRHAAIIRIAGKPRVPPDEESKLRDRDTILPTTQPRKIN